MKRPDTLPSNASHEDAVDYYAEAVTTLEHALTIIDRLSFALGNLLDGKMLLDQVQRSYLEAMLREAGALLAEEKRA